MWRLKSLGFVLRPGHGVTHVPHVLGQITEDGRWSDGGRKEIFIQIREWEMDVEGDGEVYRNRSGHERRQDGERTSGYYREKDNTRL